MWIILRCENHGHKFNWFAFTLVGSSFLWLDNVPEMEVQFRRKAEWIAFVFATFPAKDRSGEDPKPMLVANKTNRKECTVKERN